MLLQDQVSEIAARLGWTLKGFYRHHGYEMLEVYRVTLAPGLLKWCVGVAARTFATICALGLICVIVVAMTQGTLTGNDFLVLALLDGFMLFVATRPLNMIMTCTALPKTTNWQVTIEGYPIAYNGPMPMTLQRAIEAATEDLVCN